MKKPQIDLTTTSIQNHINKVGFKNKFLRLWGDNGSVLTEKHYYYPSISANDVELFKLLGVYTDLKEAQSSMSGISSAWMYLNPSKIDATDYDEDMLIQQLEFDVPDGTYTLNITPNATYQRVSRYLNAEPIIQVEDRLGLNSYTDMDALGEYIEANYEAVMNNYIVESPEDDETTKLAVMAILNGTNAFDYEIKSVEYSLVKNTKRVAIQETDDSGTTTSYKSYPYSTKSISIEIAIKQTSAVGDDDPLITSILAQVANVSAESDTADVVRSSLSSLLNNVDTGVTNDLWLNNQLRSELFSAKVLKTTALIELVSGSLDTGYQKKKTKWYKKLLAIIVFVVVVWFAPYLAPYFGATSPLAVAAFSISLATLSVSLLSAGMAAWGDETGAAWAGGFSQKVGVVSSIIGFVSIINSISTQITNAMSEVTKTALAQGITMGASETFVKAVTNIVSNYFKSSLTKISFEKALSYANQIFNMYSKNKLENLQSRLSTLEAENAENAQYEEESRSRDIGRALIKAHGELLHQDSTDKYDYQYESWNSPMHSGNICRTAWKWERTGSRLV